MSADRQPRCDAVLKKLAPETQAEIAARRAEHGLDNTVAWLKTEKGIRTNRQSLSEFCSWWHWEQKFTQLDADTQAFQDQIKKLRPELNEEQIEAFGFAYFQNRAIKTDDSETFLRYRSARAKDRNEQRKLALTERRVVLLEKKAAQADEAEKITRSELTPEQKQQKMKEVFGLA